MIYSVINLHIFFSGRKSIHVAYLSHVNDIHMSHIDGVHQKDEQKAKNAKRECKKECKKMQEKCQLLENTNINRYERYFYQLAELIYNSYASISYFA